MERLKKWYWQIVVSIVAMIFIDFIGRIIFDVNKDISQLENAPWFWAIALAGLLSQFLFIVGVVRGLLALVRKFRSFVRISK